MSAGPIVRLGAELDGVLARLNRLRARGRRTAEWTAVEELIETLFQPSRHLAVYGTLAPGAPNHSVLADVRGSWREGRVRGHLARQGWGLVHGYPALRWDPAAEEVPVHLLVSGRLPGEWERLDAFEGPGYRRILVPVRRADRLLAVANLYEGKAEGEIVQPSSSPITGA